MIDTGVYNKPIYFPTILKAKKFIAFPCSLSTITQRVGRIGRSSNGVYIGLYKKTFNFIPEEISPFLT